MKKAADIARETCRDVPDNIYCRLIRKARAMDLYKNGVPLPFIMQLLGHESMSTTSGFYAFATLEMMSEAINRTASKIGGGKKFWKKRAVWKAIYIPLTDLKYYAEEFQPSRIISRELHIFSIVFFST